MYTIERMRLTEHSAESWSTLFDCDEGTRREFKLMHNGRAIELELSFLEAQKLKNCYEADDAYAQKEAERYEQYPESFIKL